MQFYAGQQSIGAANGATEKEAKRSDDCRRRHELGMPMLMFPFARRRAA